MAVSGCHLGESPFGGSVGLPKVLDHTWDSVRTTGAPELGPRLHRSPLLSHGTNSSHPRRCLLRAFLCHLTLCFSEFPRPWGTVTSHNEEHLPVSCLTPHQPMSSFSTRLRSPDDRPNTQTAAHRLWHLSQLTDGGASLQMVVWLSPKTPQIQNT